MRQYRSSVLASSTIALGWAARVSPSSPLPIFLEEFRVSHQFCLDPYCRVSCLAFQAFLILTSVERLGFPDSPYLSFGV